MSSWRTHLVVVLFALASGPACGANVVFVGEDEGGGNGAGASPSNGGNGDGGAPSVAQTGNTTSVPDVATSGMGGASPLSCETLECVVGQVVCTCTGECVWCSEFECVGFDTSTSCEWLSEDALCTCFAGGEEVGSCKQLDLQCDTTDGCCNEVFKGLL